MTKRVVIDIEDMLESIADQVGRPCLVSALKEYRDRGFAIVLAGGVAEGPDHLALNLTNGADADELAHTIEALEAAGLFSDELSVRRVHIGPQDFVIDDKAVTMKEFAERDPEELAALLLREVVAQ